MLYVISCVDKADHFEVRAANRPAHVEYLRGSMDDMFAAGPTLTEDGEGMNGSVIIMEFASAADAQNFADNDPYNKAGLFESVSIRPWKKVLP
ncbi:MAG: YciI family protein [Rhodospirillales bacterium]|jgi:uncharacterized protein|nr:YciI family protein [Rhodospirillales bacterium]